MFISSTDIPDGDEEKVDRTSIQDIDLPLSWVNPLNITSQSIILKEILLNLLNFSDFQKRYPNSYKKLYFKKTCIEKYAPYSMKDGIILKISEFADYNCKL